MDLSSRARPAPLHEFGTPRTAPPPGSAKPGNLYADLQSRTLWLGVDPSVDPLQAVLVSDIISLTDAIIEAEQDANAYTDTQILTRAPTVHTHTANQIIDFDDAVADAITSLPALSFTKGMIMMWSGSLADIGTGALAGWSLCDGSNGTPDLRDKFIIGAGNKAVGEKNAGGALNTGSAGTHTHTINGTAISNAQMPSHGHLFSATGNGTATGYDNVAGGHQHGISGASAHIGSTGSGNYDPGAYTYLMSSYAGEHQHYHNLSVSVAVSGSTQNTGLGQTHTHTENAAGDHYHTIAANGVRDALAYYALAFIMKL